MFLDGTESHIKTTVSEFRENRPRPGTHMASRQPQTNHKLGLQEEVQRYETELIREALQRTHGNQRRAAKILGVKVSTLNCKIKRLGIELAE